MSATFLPDFSADIESARLDRMAAEMFPKDWNRANNKPRGKSKARKHLRDRVTGALKMAELRKADASCRTCDNFKPAHGPGMRGERICELGSDFYGYQTAKPDGLCVSWCAKVTPMKQP